MGTFDSRQSRLSLRGERGQSTTELALALPVLLLVLFAVIQFGIAFNHYEALTDAVRAGARKAAVSRLDPTAVTDVVAQVQASAANLDQTKLQVTVTPPPWMPGSDVTVTATYPYSIDLLGIVVSAGNLSSTTTERVE